jgi:hypothetical protein
MGVDAERLPPDAVGQARHQGPAQTNRRTAAQTLRFPAFSIVDGDVNTLICVLAFLGLRHGQPVLRVGLRLMPPHLIGTPTQYENMKLRNWPPVCTIRKCLRVDFLRGETTLHRPISLPLPFIRAGNGFFQRDNCRLDFPGNYRAAKYFSAEDARGVPIASAIGRGRVSPCRAIGTGRPPCSCRPGAARTSARRKHNASILSRTSR